MLRSAQMVGLGMKSVTSQEMRLPHGPFAFRMAMREHMKSSLQILGRVYIKFRLGPWTSGMLAQMLTVASRKPEAEHQFLWFWKPGA